jgi:AraC-like DNA-binding protein
MPEGQTWSQKVVPHPAMHLVFEAGAAEIEAISRRPFVRRLEGRGQVLGIKFRPAGFRPFLGRPAATVAGQRFPASTVAALATAALADLTRRIGRADDVNDLAGEVDVVLRSLGVAPLAMTVPVNTMVDHIVQDRSILRVDDLADRLGTSTRRLQRLFAEHVGLGPKWVINRCRILEAAELAATDAPVDWARLAADLGYSDQSHLTRDFAAAVGTPPHRYTRQSTSPDRDS